MTRRPLLATALVAGALLTAGCSNDTDLFSEAWDREIDSYAALTLDMEVDEETGRLPDAKSFVTGTQEDVKAKQQEIDDARAQAKETICTSMLRSVERKPIEDATSPISVQVAMLSDDPALEGSEELQQFTQRLRDEFTAQHGESPKVDLNEDSEYMKYSELRDAYFDEAWETQGTQELRDAQDKRSRALDELFAAANRYTVDRCDINVPDGK